jgi:hypothetical protein
LELFDASEKQDIFQGPTDFAGFETQNQSNGKKNGFARATEIPISFVM